MEKVHYNETQKRTGKRRIALRKILSITFAVLFLVSVGISVYAAETDPGDLAKEILNAKVTETGSSSIQDWIDNKMTPPSDGSEWYVMCLHQYGSYDYSRFAGRVINYLKKNTLTNVVSKQKFALTLLACNISSQYYIDLTKDSLIDQGVMTYIYALHLCNNGIELSMSQEDIISKLLSLQNKSGWSVTNGDPDVDVTAMAITALSVHYDDEKVKKAIDESIMYLSEIQLDTGSFEGFSEENCETVAQVIIALSSLEIDCETDPRFIKNGKSPVDALISFQTEPGQYSHSVNGETNSSATNQAVQALVSFYRMKNGKGPLFVFDKQLTTEPVFLETEETETTANEKNISKGIQTYKIISCAVVLGLAIAVCVILVIKKSPKKNLIFVVIVAVVLIVVVFLTNISLPSDRGKDIVKDNPIGTITMTIECRVLIGEKSDYVPSDGYILKSEEFKIEEGDTALGVLREASSKYNFQLGVKNGYYVLGINNLYEKEFGDLSGWMYYINGVSASVGANEYVLKDGDVIEWRYTRNIGKDLQD